jgi:hypothetical protein
VPSVHWASTILLCTYICLAVEIVVVISNGLGRSREERGGYVFLKYRGRKAPFGYLCVAYAPHLTSVLAWACTFLATLDTHQLSSYFSCPSQTNIGWLVYCIITLTGEYNTG